MNTALIGKNKPEVEFQVVANRETANIAIGTPVVFVMDGTNDGLDVQLPGSSTAAKISTLTAGIVCGMGLTGNMLAGSTGTGNSQPGQLITVYGFAPKALITQVLTRSATSAVWPSTPASNIGDVLSVNSVMNALNWLSSASAVVNSGVQFVLGQSIASITTQASGAAGTYAFIPVGGTASTVTNGNGASSDTIAYLTSLAKVFVRCM